MSDLVGRLRNHGWSAAEEAADEITRLSEIVAGQRRTIEALMVGMPDEGTTPVIRRIAWIEAERDALRAEVANLKTVMIAAAEEIQAHWEAHCDAEGYGPANLMRRLEEGIPSEYGYTAGAFGALRAERDALRAEVEALKSERDTAELMSLALRAERDALRTVAGQVLRDMQAQGVLLEWHSLLSDTLDAARAQEPNT